MKSWLLEVIVKIVIFIAKAFLTLVFIIAVPLWAGCGSSGPGGGGGGDNHSDGSGAIDRSSLPDTAPAFEVSPMSFPNSIDTDLRAFGVYNLTSSCDIVHYGWDYIPDWGSYADNKVPIVAMADGIISDVILRSTNTYQGQEHNTYIVRLAVAREVDVHYTFEPFITFDDTYASQWLNVNKGDAVSAGDVIGYLPKVDGNLGEDLIHIDWKIGTGPDQNSYVCPLDYFSAAWRTEDEQKFLSKVSGSCTQLCYE